MSYWLLGYLPHGSEISFWSQKDSWNFYSNISDERVKTRDVVYIVGGDVGIYAWGFVSEIIKNQSDEKDSITVGRGAIDFPLISYNQINQSKELDGVLSFPNGNPTFLTNKQVKALNNLMALSGAKQPPPPRKQQFILNQPAESDEDLHTEYKEVKPQNVAQEAYEFAVAYRNKEGGSIYFGIRDKNKIVVGMNLSSVQRDKINKSIENRLFTIKPPLSPSIDYSIEFHKVIDEQGNEIPDLYIIELEVKRGSGIEHTTAGGKVYEKTYSGRKKMN